MLCVGVVWHILVFSRTARNFCSDKAQLAHQPKSQSLDNTHWNYTILLLYLEGGQKRCLLRDQIKKKSKKSKLSQKVLDKSKISNRFKIRKMQILLTTILIRYRPKINSYINLSPKKFKFI